MYKNIGVWVLVVWLSPFYALAGIGVLLYSVCYPFLIPGMLLIFGRVLSWEEYWQWEVK